MDDKQKSCDRCGEPAMRVVVTKNSGKTVSTNLCPACANREHVAGSWVELERGP
jgi:formylmethanofuran dehydrogenase subunit E